MTMTSISATLTPADGQSPVVSIMPKAVDHRDAVISAVAIIKAKLPFLVDLTADDLLSQPQSGTQSSTQDGR